MNDQKLRNLIDNKGGFGLREYKDKNGVWWIVNVIGIEFTVYPSGIGNEPDVSFDITRQMHKKSIKVNVTATNPPTHDLKVGNRYLYRFETKWPNRVEQTNDDAYNGDESVKPVNDHMYVGDAPGKRRIPLHNHGVGLVYQSTAWNFQEFMRVRLDGVKPKGNGDENGSRCSAYYRWNSCQFFNEHSKYSGYLVRGPTKGPFKFDGKEQARFNCISPGRILRLDFYPPYYPPLDYGQVLFPRKTT